MKTKARILQIGTLDGRGQPWHWVFDCNDILPTPSGIEICSGTVTHVGGYTLDELREIMELNRQLAQLTRGS